MSTADLLHAALPLPPLPPPPTCPPGARCALTGRPLAHGYPAGDILPSSTGDPLDVLGGDIHGWLSPEAAAVLSGDWNLGGRAVFAGPDGTLAAFYPRLAGETLLRLAEEPPQSCHWKRTRQETQLAAPEPAEESPSAKTEESPSAKKLKTLARDGQMPRPLWRDLVQEVWPARAGQTCLLLLAADPKKRVWYKARVGTLGEQTPLYLFDPSRAQKRSVCLSWPRLLATLALVETVYAAGFTKRGIEAFLPHETRALVKNGMAQTFAWEAALHPLRETPEFLVSILIAQKPTVETQKT